MNPRLFLVLNLALGFYNVGTIWAMEIDIFRSWRLVGPEDFPALQEAHWKKLPYWIFAPVGLALIGSIVLLWHHPSGSPVWAVLGTFLSQLSSLVLTVAFWARWQAALSRDPLGSRSPYLKRILRTHWVRTVLISASGGFLLVWAIIVL